MKNKFSNFEEVKKWYLNETAKILGWLRNRPKNDKDFKQYCIDCINQKYNTIFDLFELEVEEIKIINEIRYNFYMERNRI